MDISARKISDLITENYEYALVLHHFGIEFYHYQEHTLAQVCESRGLNPYHVIKILQEIPNEVSDIENFASYSIEVLIQYLVQTHDIFTKTKLPYVANLIQNLKPEKTQNQQLVNDLQLLFPLFIEDFIHHIHAEEKTFFQYILTLFQALNGNYNPAKLFYQMEQHSLQYFAMEHHTHDDEMRGIRDLTNHYQLDTDSDLHLKVIFAELKSLEKELQLHAKIEDEILFVKALQLEKQVKSMLSQKTLLN